MKTKITQLFKKRNRRSFFLNWVSALVLALSLWGGESFGQAINNGPWIFGYQSPSNSSTCDAYSSSFKTTFTKVLTQSEGVIKPTKVPVKNSLNKDSVGFMLLKQDWRGPQGFIIDYNQASGGYTLLKGHQYKIKVRAFKEQSTDKFYQPFYMYLENYSSIPSVLADNITNSSCSLQNSKLLNTSVGAETYYLGRIEDHFSDVKEFNNNLLDDKDFDNKFFQTTFTPTQNFKFIRFGFSKIDSTKSSYNKLYVYDIQIIHIGDPSMIKNKVAFYGVNKSTCTTASAGDTTFRNILCDNATFNFTNVSVSGGDKMGGTPIYTYKWQVSYDEGATWNVVGTSSTLTDFKANTDFLIRRLVTTPDYPSGEYSAIGKYYFMSCPEPPVSTATICNNQTIYNCNPNQLYKFKSINGAQHNSLHDNNLTEWKISTDNKSTWETVFRNQNYGKNIQYPYLSSSYLTFTKNDKSVQKVYVKREISEYWCTDPWLWIVGAGGCKYHPKETSNIVELTLCSFPDPNKESVDFTYDALSCTKTSTKLTAIIPASLKTAVTKVEWKLPSSMSSGTLQGTLSQAGEIYPNTITDWDYWSSVSNAPKGGTVQLIVTFADGSVLTKSKNITPPAVPNITFASNPISVCGYTPVVVSPTVSNGSGNYTYTWNQWFAKCNNSPTCSSVSITATDLGQEVTPSVKLTVKDNANSCTNTATLNIYNPNAAGMGVSSWNQFDIFTNFVAQQKAKPNTDIVYSQIGNPYYIGADGNLWSYKYTTGYYWINSALTSNGGATGKLAIYEPSAGNIKLFYNKGSNLYYYTNVEKQEDKVTDINLSNGNLKPGSDGTIYYVSSTNSIKAYSSGASAATVEISQIYAGSNFEVSKGFIYYVNTSQQLSKYNIATKTSNTIWGTNVLPQSVIVSSNNGDVFFTGTDHSIYQVTYGNTSSQITNSSSWCNGNFAVNKETGVLYYAGYVKPSGTDHNIYQLFYANGWWNPPYKLSISNKYDIDINDPLIAATEAQAGAVAYRNPNAFYVSASGYIKVILYLTTNGCIAKNQRIGEEQQDYLPVILEEKTAETQSNVSVAPNPVEAHSEVTVNILDDNSVISLSIYDAQGTKICNLPTLDVYEQGQYTFSISNKQLSAGIYLLKCLINEKLETVKIIVK